MRKRVSVLLVFVMLMIISKPMETNGAIYMEDLKRKDKEEEIIVEEVDKEIIEIDSTSEKEVDSIDEKFMEETINKVKDSKEKVIKLKIDKLEGYNIDIEFPNKTILDLYGNKIDLEIETKKYNLEIPYTTFSDISLEGEDIFKLKINTTPNRYAADKIRDVDAVKESLEIYFEKTRGRVKTKYKEFKDDISIKINIEDLGNKDILAIYSIEDKQVFLTGKIKDTIMEFETKSLGEIAIVESYIGYSDTRKHWGRNEIESMAAKNVVNGKGYDKFKPNDEVTRAEFAKMLINSLEIELNTYEDRFEDVSKKSWYSDYIETAYNLGLIKGKTDKNFKPEDKITREEMASMISRLDKENLEVEDIEKTLSKFKDGKKISSWAKEDIAKVVKLGLMSGKKDGFDPKANATRAEAATIMYRVYDIY